jgi:hypothetical protein
MKWAGGSDAAIDCTLLTAFKDRSEYVKHLTEGDGAGIEYVFIYNAETHQWSVFSLNRRGWVERFPTGGTPLRDVCTSILRRESSELQMMVSQAMEKAGLSEFVHNLFVGD